MIQRFEELEAGRILGDLDSEETREFQELSKSLGKEPDFSLELAAAAIETEFLQSTEESLPAHLQEQLQGGMADFVKPQADPEKVVAFPERRSALASPITGWAVAAVLALLLVAVTVFKQPEPAPPIEIVLSPADARDDLLTNAADLVKTAFTGTEAYAGMSGRVVWSDSRQEGYMTFSNLEANDPTSKQYQLWIVDPTRDEKPVDGGVFDIPAVAGEVVIPIDNPLMVNNPAAFVITLEQPGGVVVSKQETVVALATTS